MRHRAAPTRRQLRRRRLNRRQRAVSLLLLAGLAAGAAVPCVMLQPWTASAETRTRFDRSTALTRTDLVETSRSVKRTERDGSGQTIMPDSTVTYPKEGSILTLYAQWKRIPETVLPDTGGHDGTPTRILAGGGLAVFGGLVFALLAERRRRHMV